MTTAVTTIEVESDANRPDAYADRLTLVIDPGFRLAQVMLGSRSAAEDAVQEAALKAWRKRAQFRGGSASYRAWFLTIVANECRMARRGRWWSVVRLAEPPRELSASPEDRVLAATGLQEALRGLGAEDRLALYLYHYLDLPIEEVARVLRVSPAGARTRIHRAGRRFRAQPGARETDR